MSDRKRTSPLPNTLQTGMASVGSLFRSLVTAAHDKSAQPNHARHIPCTSYRRPVYPSWSLSCPPFDNHITGTGCCHARRSEGPPSPDLTSVIHTPRYGSIDFRLVLQPLLLHWAQSRGMVIRKGRRTSPLRSRSSEMSERLASSWTFKLLVCLTGDQ